MEENKLSGNKYSGESRDNHLQQHESTDMKVVGCFDLTQNDTVSPPLRHLPPIYPLVGLYQSEANRKQASIEVFLKYMGKKRTAFDLIEEWRRLAEKKHQLHELFTVSEQGIKENRASMARFYEIIKEEKNHQTVLEKEKVLNHLRVTDYREVQEEFTHYVQIYSMFEKFLESVAEVGDGWRNVGDILDRYETLKNTGLQCAKILESELEQASDLRKRMVSLMEEKSSKLKNLTNRNIHLQVDTKNARDKRVYWEHMMQRIKNHVLNGVQETMSLNEGIHDLYRNICHRRKVPSSIPRYNVRDQVDFIHKNIIFFKEVVTIASSKAPKTDTETSKEVKKTKRKSKNIK